MSLESVRTFLAEYAPDLDIIKKECETSTVRQAAEAHGVEPEKIAKTLALSCSEKIFLLVISGTARLDNKKARQVFGGKVKMLGAEQTEVLTSHPVGGVCPFGLAFPLKVYCDISIKRFDEILPAAGSTHSAVKISPHRLATLTGAEFVDVCQHPDPII